MSVGGDILEITFNHPSLGSGTIYPMSSEDSAYDLGGFRSEDDTGKVAGNGEMVDSITRKRWMFESPVSWDMNTREDLEKINKLAGDPVQADWTITNVNGTVYGAQGKPVGELPGNGNKATFTLKVSGGGELKKIVG